jgi:hypothetical protein
LNEVNISYLGYHYKYYQQYHYSDKKDFVDSTKKPVSNLKKANTFPRQGQRDRN